MTTDDNRAWAERLRRDLIAIVQNAGPDATPRSLASECRRKAAVNGADPSSPEWAAFIESIVGA